MEEIRPQTPASEETLRQEPGRQDPAREEASFKRPISERKRAAILANLAKANAVKRRRASYARSRHNALKHGMFVRSPQELLKDRGADPRAFRRLCGDVRRCFLPRNLREKVIVRRLAEALWRRLRLFVALARWEERSLRRTLRMQPRVARLSAEETLGRADELEDVLLDQNRFWQCERLSRGEVERMLRLLLRARRNRKRDRAWIGRQGSPRELAELSPDPADWKRRYAACVPLPKTVKELKNRK